MNTKLQVTISLDISLKRFEFLNMFILFLQRVDSDS